jgi:hypothetical protein
MGPSDLFQHAYNEVLHARHAVQLDGIPNAFVYGTLSPEARNLLVQAFEKMFDLNIGGQGVDSFILAEAPFLVDPDLGGITIIVRIHTKET